MDTRKHYRIGNCSWGPSTGIALAILALGISTPLQAQWQAYNDSAFKPGQVNAEHVTTYGLGRNFAGEAESGPLRNLETGTPLPVQVEYVETFSTGSVNNAGDAAQYASGSDAEAVFGGIVDLSGNMSYGDSPGWHVDLIITGLDPSRRYTFAGTVDRAGGPGYADRVTHWRILGADSFTYASSTGAHRVSEAAVEFSTGDNPAGYIARWTDISPGADGEIIIRTTHTVGEANGGMPGAHASRGYAGGVFMVEEQPAETLLWQAFNDSAFKPGQVNAEHVTTFGLGRNFAGEAEFGPLLNVATGEPTGTIATYTEVFSTGSVNNAGDAADYAPASDAAEVFAGIVDLSGNMSYGDSPGWHVDLTFTGLNPQGRYTFVGTVDRAGGEGYADRVTNWRILDARDFTYNSSSGAHRVSESAVEFSTGNNPAGYVARWINIQPAADGSFTIRTSHTVGEANGGMPGAHASRGYAGGVFMLAAQSTLFGGPTEQLITFNTLHPADAETAAHPNTPVRIGLVHGEHAVDPTSVVLFFDDLEVTPDVQIDGDTTVITYQPPTRLAAGSSHSVRVEFTDDNTTPRDYARDWSFQVLDDSEFPVLPASMAIPFDGSVHRHRGFALDIVAPDPVTSFPISGIDDLAFIFFIELDNLVDPTLFNEEGYVLERDTINYQINGGTAGNKAGDRLFPGIPGSDVPGENFAIEAHTLLHLRPGYYHFNITMQPGFRLYAGDANNLMEIPATFTPCTNCGGDDAPWYMDFVVTEAGLYPFRLQFFNVAGNASLEWLEVAPSGLRFLINEAHPDAIAAYIPADMAGELPLDILLSIGMVEGQIQLQWEGGSLESSINVNGPWTAVPGATSPHTPTAAADQTYYRVRQ